MAVAFPKAGTARRADGSRSAASDEPAAVPGEASPDPWREALRLRSVVGHAPLVLFELDREGVFTLSEGSALSGLGRAPGEVVGRSVFDLYAERPDILDAVRRALAGEELRRLVPVAGRVHEVAYTPARGPDGAVSHVIGVAHDVTELHERTEALARSEARLRDFAQASSDWLWETDAEHRFTWFSEGAGRAARFDPAASIGRTRHDSRIPDPADGDWDAHARDLAAHRPFRGFRFGFLDDDGRRRVVSVSGVPVFDRGGLFRGHRGASRDVTREVEAEERLRESEARFRSLVTNMRGIVFCRGVAGRDEHGYDGGGIEHYGADLQELAGTVDLERWYEAVHPADLGAYLEAERRRKERGEAYALDYRIVHPGTGEPRWMREVAWVVGDAGGGPTYLDSYIVDVTEAKRAEAALRESQERYERLIEGAPVAILIFRAGGRCVYANPEALRLLGARDAAALIGRGILDLVGRGVARDRLERRLADLAAGAAGGGEELPFRRLDGGGTVVAEASMAAVLEDGAPAVQLVLVDVTARRRAEASVRHMAHHDALTGLPNRVLLLDRLEQALAAARRGRHGAGPGLVALMILDLDGFKEVNDTLGHAAGDALLREVARRVRLLMREADTLARLGGDEFAVVLPGGDSPRAAAALAGRIIDAVGRPVTVDGHEVRAGASVGIALHPEDGASPGGLLQRADLALYRAKEAGRGRFCFFEPGMDGAAQARRRMALDLRAALERDELELAYQPIVGLKGPRRGLLAGVEALLRWNPPGRDAVPPSEFVPVAEGTGLIRPLGARVLDRACAAAAAWAERGLEVPVAVNVSAVQLRDPEFGRHLTRALERHRLPAGRLCLELTESLLIDPGLDGIGALLGRLAGLGVRIAIDDFGTGHSSLVNLKRLPVHHVKVDRSFVRGIGGDAESEAIIGATVRLAHSLGKLVVAEGVETEAQERFLRRLGCDRAQGFLYAEPRPAGAIPACAAALAAARRARRRVPHASRTPTR